MAPNYYSNGYGYTGSSTVAGGGGGGGGSGSRSSSSSRRSNGNNNNFPAFYSLSHRGDHDSNSLLDDLRAFLSRSARSLWVFWKHRGRRMLYASLVRAARQLRRNLTPARLFSLPHLLVVLWVFVLLWGERWVYHSRVEGCQWRNWEQWPSGTQPHHLVFVADPQLIDPHSYPGRPWPLNPLTVLVTDNYLRRSYDQLQLQLRPDTLFFLGDLFDGGREWKTARGDFSDPEWGPHPKDEQKHLKRWHRKYGESFWLKEYRRFGDIFFDAWNLGGAQPGAGQRGRKLISSLPGNHDLGFGSEIKPPVRDRFETYFGEGNRVDVIGNHTFVSVDTVSLSAASSAEAQHHDLRSIYAPVVQFLEDVRGFKRKAVERELRGLRGEPEAPRLGHRIEDADKADFGDVVSLDPGEGRAELPSILLSHVPLYRPPGTPCGPAREHWPPAKPPAGQTAPVVPDHRNAISVSGGYQYQNVLSEGDSIRLIESIGNVVHVFSGDDHDYCELRHDAKQQGVPEITVKSMSMAMGVSSPGFLMVSLYNPIDGNGRPLARGAGEKGGEATFQTHLCLLPKFSSILAWYAGFALPCLVLLTVRALIVPILNLPRFALEPAPADGSALPVFKAKVEDYEEYAFPAAGSSASSRFLHPSAARDRGANGLSATATEKFSSNGGGPSAKSGRPRRSREQGKWGWAGRGSSRGPPKIRIGRDDDDGGGGGGGLYDGGKWKAASTRTRPRSRINVVFTEFWTTTWRLVWMVGLLWFYLAWRR